MAARNANVSVNGFGFFLLVLYPGAFVEIDSNELGKKHNFGITALCINVLNSFRKGLVCSKDTNIHRGYLA